MQHLLESTELSRFVTSLRTIAGARSATQKRRTSPALSPACLSYSTKISLNGSAPTNTSYRPQDIHFPRYQGHCVNLSVINGGTTRMLSKLLVYPAPAEQKYMRLADYSFLVESTHRSKKVLFDLAIMKDMLTRMPPVVKSALLGDGKGDPAVLMDDVIDVPDTIKAHGMDLAAINSIIWSHSHIDHTGDPSVFPSGTDLIVGPGFKASCMPGYPKNLNSTVLQSAFEGRAVEETSFDGPQSTVIGGFRAVDFFRDGSFWLLECPGHTGHHMGALCRTTEDSWVLMGADCCHTVAQLRPSPSRPLPESVPAKYMSSATTTQASHGYCICGHLARLLRATPGVNDPGTFYDLSPMLQEDLAQAQFTLDKLKAFDGRDDVLVILAHDATLLDVIEFFPRCINEWKSRGWADEARWRFLKELDRIDAARI